MDRIIAARVFAEIADRGSLTGAAGALGMSRAMVTRYLGAMERWAGTRLLHRTTRRVGLTAAGELTLARCRRLLEVAGEVTAAGATDEPAGRVRVAASESLAAGVLVRALIAYQARHPRTSVDLIAGDRTVDLVAERIDLAVRSTNTVAGQLVARPLGRCASVICAAPAYLARRGTPATPQDLSRHRCLMHDYVGQSRWTLEAIGSNAAPVTVPVQGPLSADSASVLLAAALDGAGIAMLPAFAARPHVEAGRLVALLPGWQPPAMGIYGVYATRRQMTPLLRTLLDFLVEWFAAQGFACEEQERGGAAIRTAARATLPEPAEH